MMGELTNEELKAAFRSVMTSSKEVNKELSTISIITFLYFELCMLSIL